MGRGVMTESIDRRAWLSLAVLAGAFGIVSISLSVMNVAFDPLAAEFNDSSAATIGWVLTGYTTMTAALLIAAGRLADAYGRKRLFLIGIVTYVVTSLLGAVAWSAPVIILARVGQGAGAALVTPTSLALLMAVFPVSKRSAVIGIWGSVGSVAAAGGPALGGLVVDTLGWRWVFWLNIPLCFIVFVAGRIWLDESETSDDAGIPDPIGIIFSAAAVGFFALGLAQSGEWGWTDWRTLAALIAGPTFAWLLVARSGTHPNPVLDLKLFESRFFNIGNVVTLLFNIGFTAMILNNVLFLIRVWGYSSTAAGFGITPSPLSAALVAPFAGRLADRIGTRAMIIPGLGLLLIGLGLLIVGIGDEPTYWTRWFPAALFFGSGVGFTFTNLSSAAVADTPPSRLALASATNGAARSVGTVLGPALVIGIVGSATGLASSPLFDRVWMVSAVVVAIAIVVAWQLPRRTVAG
ncbi:MAG: EmrB/QacA subfamily drug resistance transporter [Candidatus Poriferisodalaceae bacterium]|jgi:EmrB/QacA subfamily drug resistance transporter